MQPETFQLKAMAVAPLWVTYFDNPYWKTDPTSFM